MVSQAFTLEILRDAPYPASRDDDVDASPPHHAWILGLADDYSWAVVGSPDRDYLWMLARTPTIDAERSRPALAAARANGFDTERPMKTPHTTGAS